MIKRILQNLIIRTNFLPFSLFYKIYYILALKIIVFILKKQKEVVAVYLTAGMATGDYLCGLSDIDLIVVVSGGKENKQKIEKIYKKLTRLIPILVYEERGIFTTDEIDVAYTQNIFYLKYKFFIECKKTGKLLYGRDILNDFPDLDIRDSREPVLSQLAFIWALLEENFFERTVKNTIMRNYLCYKLSADSCKAFLLAKDNLTMRTRREALERAKEYLDKDSVVHIRALQAMYNKRFNSGDGNLLQDTYNFCFSLLNKTVTHINNSLFDYDKENEINARINFTFESSDFILSETNKQKINNIVELAKSKYSEHIQSILLSPIDLAHIDERLICLFIIPKGNLPLESIKKFQAIVGDNQSNQLLYLYIITPDMAFALNRTDFIQPYTVIFLPSIIPLTFLYLTTRACVILGEPLVCKASKKVLFNYYSQNFLESIAQDKKIVLALINEPTVVRLTNNKFQLFFWQALALKLVESSVILGKNSIPLSSAQVYRYCKESRFLDPSWLKKFHDEYKKDLNGVSSNSEAYFPEAIAALKEIYDLYPGESII